MTQHAGEAITTVAPDVYDLTLTEEPVRYRAFLFDGEEPTLVDCGLKQSADTLIQRLETLDIEPTQLVITHGDYDHVGGLDRVVAEYGTETFVPKQTNLVTETAADHRYEHGDAVGPFEAIHVPGHSPDNYGLVHRDRPIAVMGDSVIGADWRGLPAGYFVLVEGVWSEDPREAERNLERFQEYDFDIGLVFHGTSVLESAREKLDAYVDHPEKPADWPSVADLPKIRVQLD